MSDTERLGYRADKDALQVMQGDGDADARPHNREQGCYYSFADESTVNFLVKRESSHLLFLEL